MEYSPPAVPDAKPLCRGRCEGHPVGKRQVQHWNEWLLKNNDNNTYYIYVCMYAAFLHA